MGGLFKKLLILLAIFLLPSCSLASNNVYEEYKLQPNEQIFTKSTYKISVIDPTITTNWSASMYPGLRGANQLVVYTPSYGISTGTNEFGAEAVINGNIVTSLSGADSLIPSDGLVISAHGKAKKWLNDNITIGTKISIDKNTKTLTVYTTSDSYIFGAKSKIAEAQTMMNYYQRNSYAYNSKPTRDCISKAKKYLRKAEHSKDEIQKYATLAISSANEALATAIPYKANEIKGIWIRPTHSNETEIIAILDRLKSIGINNVYLETFFHGKTIFPSEVMKKYGFIEQYETFVGADPLKIWIEEGHKRNIKINVWFQTFYVGNKPQVGENILAVHPEWSNINLKNIESTSLVSSTSEHNGYFLDPANQEVQDFLVDLAKEIITKYKPDGINLDYIRYPQSVSARYYNYALSNWGYTKYARDEFKLIYGTDPAEITYGTKLWHEWDNYRQDKITLLVEQISKLCRQNKVGISAVVFPNKYMALETKQQDWSTWSDNNYIDALTPLYLTCDSKTIKVMIYDMLKEMSPRTKLYAGLFVTFMGGSEEDLIRQIHETRKLNLGGIILFDYAHLQDKYIKTLTTSVFINNVPIKPISHKKGKS